MQNIFKEIEQERNRQIDVCKHGGDTDLFDRTNTQNDWVSYITAYAGRASNNVARNEKEKCDFRENMIKVAALAVAAIQAYDKQYAASYS